jgi:DNA replication protein DnaC
VILQGWSVAYREGHVLLEEIADAALDGTRKDYLASMQKVPLFILDDRGLRKLPSTAAEDLLELVMRRYERTRTILTSNRPVDERGKLLGDTTAVSALPDRLGGRTRTRRRPSSTATVRPRRSALRRAGQCDSAAVTGIVAQRTASSRSIRDPRG